MRHLSLLVLAALASTPASAQPMAIPFEAALGRVRVELQAERSRQTEAKQSNLALEIERAARETSTLAAETSFLRRDIAEVRRLSREPDGQPYLREAIQRLMWGMTYFHDKSSYLAAQVVRLSGYVRYRDSELLYPAMLLDEAARRLQAEFVSASIEVRAAAADLRRAGRQVEANSLERKNARIEDSIRMLALESRRLLGKLRR